MNSELGGLMKAEVAKLKQKFQGKESKFKAVIEELSLENEELRKAQGTEAQSLQEAAASKDKVVEETDCGLWLLDVEGDNLHH